MLTKLMIATLSAAIFPTVAMAQDMPVVVADSGDTAWILISSALVLLMTLPGLALFYGGLVRARNILSVLMQCFAICGTVSLLWAVCGYSLAFSEGSAWLGDARNVMLHGLTEMRADTTIPESTFALFQMTFAIITPALVIGAFAERVRFGWVVAFSTLWSLAVYVPVAHWVWGGGWLADLGVLDFAGGIVVHTTAGIAALVLALMIGVRSGFPKTPMAPHSPTLTMAGAGLLWVGWFGFNGGSALSAGDDASTAIINTHLAACAAALAWIAAEKIKIGKPTSIGIVTGAVAGLATITPAAGYIGPFGSMLLGGLGGLVCFAAVLVVKQRLKIDDSLDVFAVHGIGGMLGSLTLPLFILPALGGPGYEGGNSVGQQLVAQAIGVGVVALWTAIATLVFGWMVAMVLPMRVSAEAEHDGLDLTSHGERGWDFN
jgi:ammonium transporter, Amt family